MNSRCIDTQLRPMALRDVNDLSEQSTRIDHRDCIHTTDVNCEMEFVARYICINSRYVAMKSRAHREYMLLCDRQQIALSCGQTG